MTGQDPVGHICAEVGEAKVVELVAAFYRRVPEDDVLAPMYPESDLAGAEERLADFLVGRFGGDDRYVRRRGHPRLRMRHAQFPIDQTARDRWLAAMQAALAEVAFPEPARAAVSQFFTDVATFLIR